MLIKNSTQLRSHGNVEGRKTLLTIMEASLLAADPYRNVQKMVRIEDDQLLIGHNAFAQENTTRLQLPLVFDLEQIENIYLLGGGKAVQRMAQAVEDVLGDLITGGQINAKKGARAPSLSQHSMRMVQMDPQMSLEQSWMDTR